MEAPALRQALYTAAEALRLRAVTTVTAEWHTVAATLEDNDVAGGDLLDHLASSSALQTFLVTYLDVGIGAATAEHLHTALLALHGTQSRLVIADGVDDNGNHIAVDNGDRTPTDGARGGTRHIVVMVPGRRGRRNKKAFTADVHDTIGSLKVKVGRRHGPPPERQLLTVHRSQPAVIAITGETIEQTLRRAGRAERATLTLVATDMEPSQVAEAEAASAATTGVVAGVGVVPQDEDGREEEEEEDDHTAAASNDKDAAAADDDKDVAFGRRACAHCSACEQKVTELEKKLARATGELRDAQVMLKHQDWQKLHRTKAAMREAALMRHRRVEVSDRLLALLRWAIEQNQPEAVLYLLTGSRTLTLRPSDVPFSAHGMGRVYLATRANGEPLSIFALAQKVGQPGSYMERSLVQLEWSNTMSWPDEDRLRACFQLGEQRVATQEECLLDEHSDDSDAYTHDLAWWRSQRALRREEEGDTEGTGEE